MSVSTETLLRQALELPAIDRAALVEGLIASLDKPDPALDAMWLKEAESRLAIAPESLARSTPMKSSLSWEDKLENAIPASRAP